jgi:hypothetical protein
VFIVLTVIDVCKAQPHVDVASVHHTIEAARAACTRPEHYIVRLDYDYKR